ncbi:MAG: helix-turn-helix domain-containing protein [Bacteroidetes bacterium]|nr:helix-turn-helix domain-containing protein [Bacteroidota bacterium]
MNLDEIIKTGVTINLTVNSEDLFAWGKNLIAESKKELEQIVIEDKAETYPTPKQVSEILNVNLSTLWRWDRKGYLKTIEFGGGRRYLMSEVKALLNRGRAK